LGKLVIGLALVHSFDMASATPLCLRRWIVPLLVDHTNIASVLHNKSASCGHICDSTAFLSYMPQCHPCVAYMQFLHCLFLATIWKHDITHQHPEVDNVSIVNFRHIILEISLQADRHTHRCAYHSTGVLPQGQVNIVCA